MIRYNWIEGGNHQVDLVDADDPLIYTDTRYGETFVYGNVLVEPDDAGSRVILHYGGDSGNTTNYRQGTFYFYHNTVASHRTSSTTLLQLSTANQAANVRNNAMYLSVGTSSLSILLEHGPDKLTQNLLPLGW